MDKSSRGGGLSPVLIERVTHKFLRRYPGGDAPDSSNKQQVKDVVQTYLAKKERGSLTRQDFSNIEMRVRAIPSLTPVKKSISPLTSPLKGGNHQISNTALKVVPGIKTGGSEIRVRDSIGSIDTLTV